MGNNAGSAALPWCYLLASARFVSPSSVRFDLSTSWFIVVFSNGQWWVDHEGKPYGPYESAAAATEGAVRLARFIGTDLNWEVFAPDADARHRLVASKREGMASSEQAPPREEQD